VTGGEPIHQRPLADGQSVLGLSAVAAGLTVAIQPLAMLVASGVANGPAGQRLSPKHLLIPGLLMFAAGSAFIAWAAHASSTRWDFVPVRTTVRPRTTWKG
jgi:MFS family permease